MKVETRFKISTEQYDRMTMRVVQDLRYHTGMWNLQPFAMLPRGLRELWWDEAREIVYHVLDELQRSGHQSVTSDLTP